jgi:predicted phage gp36 major capsid-like protein
VVVLALLPILVRLTTQPADVVSGQHQVLKAATAAVPVAVVQVAAAAAAAAAMAAVLIYQCDSAYSSNRSTVNDYRQRQTNAQQHIYIINTGSNAMSCVLCLYDALCC